MKTLHRHRTGALPVHPGCRCSPGPLWAVLLVLFFLSSANAAPAGTSAAQPPPGPEACPLTGHSYKARLETPELAGSVGQEIRLSFSLEPPGPPQGFFITVNMKQTAGPETLGKKEKPGILSGFPHSRLVFHHPGIYGYEVIVSLIAKSSCGGVKADTIFRGEILVRVSPPSSRQLPAEDSGD